MRRLATATVAAGAAALSVAAARSLGRRAAGRLLDAPRTAPGEAAIGPEVDALGGEVIRLRARDGLRLAGRWLPAEPDDTGWRPEPHEAIVLLHGYTGSVAPDLVEYGPYLRRTAAVLGLDFRGHGDSDDGPSTFGLLETEDIAGALAWLGERGVTRVALMGSSMGGIAAITAVAVLGDGRLAGADMDPAAPRHVDPAPRPRIVAVIGDSVAPELEVPIASRLPGPGRRFIAARLFDGAARTLGADPRDTEPARVIGLVDPVPTLLIHGEADTTVPIEDGRRLAALAGPASAHWVVPGAGHSDAHATMPEDYERRTTDFLRMALTTARSDDASDAEDGPGPIISAPEPPAGISPTSGED
jgi:fermentation-respiration switch protein FrsA (DUF1100 family)